jgi:hypothetical protein
LRGRGNHGLPSRSGGLRLQQPIDHQPCPHTTSVKASGRKQFFFEKKNQKLLPMKGST